MVEYSIGYRFKNANWFSFDVIGIIRAMAFVVFAFMYQASIPVIYRELERANYRRMDKVIARASFGAVAIYMLVSTFGYITWVGSAAQLDQLKKTQNILEVDYNGNVAFSIAIVSLIITLVASAPLCILPAKDSFEELLFADGMSSRVNFLTTCGMVGVSFFLAVLIPQISDAITILGYTVSPLVGFIYPVAFYLKLVPNLPTYKKAAAWTLSLIHI